MPSNDEFMDTLSENTLYSKLDATSAYWQIGLAPENRLKQPPSPSMVSLNV